MTLAEFGVRMDLRIASLDELREEPSWPERTKQYVQSFKEQVLPSDEIYHYCSHKSEWEKLMGSEGYLLVRDGEIVADLVRCMN